MEDQSFSEKDSLELITKMINQAKNHYYESGLGALLWGFTNVICFTLTYLNAAVKGFHFPFNPFYLMGITFILQFYYDRKEIKHKHATSYLDNVHKYVWLSFAICVLIITIVGAIADLGYFTLPILLLLFAVPTFISGCINKFNPLIIGGILCWLLCIVAFLYRENFSYLLVAAGAVVAWIIPGFILRIRFNKNRKSQHGF